MKNWVEFMVEVQIRIFLMDKLKFKSEYYSEINSLNHIFLLYRTDPQVEVKIRILLKEAAIVSKMGTPAITL
jgi:hypothetical protein